MTTEYLLDAIGLLDDDLIQDAEQTPTRFNVVPFRRKLTSWVACLAVLAVLGYGVTHLPFGMKSDSAASGAAPSASTGTSDAPSQAPAASAPTVSEPAASSPASSIPSESESQESNLFGFRVMVTVDGLTYAYVHTYPYTEPYGTWVDALPEGCRNVGSIEPNGDLLVPHTDIGVYEGCALWLEGDGRDSTLYLELPEGGYLVCEYSQTYDFSPGGRG